MSSMSYCQRENTAGNFQQCMDTLDDVGLENLIKELKSDDENDYPTEWDGFRQVISLARDFLGYVDNSPTAEVG